MEDRDWLAKRFEENRTQLRGIAFRMLGTVTDADDAVQEAWLRVSRADAGKVNNLGGWLTTVVARVCLDLLRARKSRAEQSHGRHDSEPPFGTPGPNNAESEMALADSVGPALLVVLEGLAPAERVAFVLHDMFDLPFEEIAPIVGRSPEAARQLASRARRRVRGVDVPEGDLARHREIVSAFLAASRDGDFGALLAVLAPDAVLRADDVAVRTAAANRWGGAPSLSNEVRGAPSVADTFKGRARGASEALIDGNPGAVWAVDGRVRAAFVFAIADDRIIEIDLVMEPARLAELEIELASA